MKKLDAKVYHTKFNHIVGIVDQLKKRLYFDEQENHMFGEYMLRYMPVLLNNTLTEAFCSCLDPISLQYFKVYLSKKNVELREIHKDKLNLMQFVREQEELMLSQQTVLIDSIDKSISKRMESIAEEKEEQDKAD